VIVLYPKPSSLLLLLLPLLLLLLLLLLHPLNTLHRKKEETSPLFETHSKSAHGSLDS
jgi:hypothetical protein